MNLRHAVAGFGEALRRAYPNYFADTTVFVAEARKAIN